jgi:tetratricopeptide (TPR) repeat protein
VQRLLQKDPGARFRSAAEATAALLAVTDASPAPPPSVRSDPFATLPLLRPAPIAPVELTIPTLARLPVHTPLPAGAGLGLHGLREVPPFGRAAELDQLWGLLRAVTEARRPEVCEVAGPEGLGKSALADGFATRAAEVGVRVVRFPMEGGPAALVREELRCAGASGDELGALALVRLGFEGIHDAADRALIRRSLSDGDPAGAARLLVGLARGRPVVLVVDGPAAAAWSLAQRVLDGEPAPVLIVVTTAGEQATPLSPAPRRIALGRLPDDDIATLVRSLLPLDRRAVDRIVRAAEGRPTVAVELLDRLVHAGLRAGPDGLGPADPDAAIEGRDPAVSLEPDVRDRLEVAAALGASVRDAEWAAACAIRGCPLADADLLEPFVRARLIEPTPGGLRFRRPQFREALLAGARARGVEAAIHRACAAALADPSPDRLGLHLAASGDVENSRLPLVRGAEMRLVRSDYLGAEELLDHLVFPTPGDDASERLRAEADLLRVRALFGRGLHDAAGKLARDVAARVRGKGWNNLLGRALRYRGMAAFRGGRDAQLAEAFHVWALDALGGTDPEEEARCLLHRAEAMVRQRAGEEARPVLDAAAAAFERLGDLQGVADCEIARCEAALLVQGGAAEAARNARSALDRFAEIGNLYGVARCYNALGDLARRAQAFGDAAEAYRNATTACERIGAPDRLTVEANLALVLEEQGRFDEAERRLQGALHGRQAPAVSLLVYLHAALLPCLAARADRAAFADTLPRVADEIAALRRVDRDLAIPLTLATNLLSGREGWRTERNAVRTLAMAQWRQLGGREAQEALTALEGEGDET